MILRELMQKRTCQLNFSPVHPDEVLKILKDLTNSAAVGLDGIDTYVLKLVKEELNPAITHIVNLSLSEQKYPTKWKTSKIIPLYKKDDPLCPKNYRPVSIIPILSKVLERVVHNQMIKYITENNLFHPNQHAYRQKHSTTTALIQLTDTWAQALDSGEMAGVCLLDMTAAFDSVDHDLLLKKLPYMGSRRTY